jgi:hypothetical protein
MLLLPQKDIGSNYQVSVFTLRTLNTFLCLNITQGQNSNESSQIIRKKLF